MRSTSLAFAAALLVVGCRQQLASADGGQGGLVDFSLLDLNPASATAGQPVSPSQFKGHVSAWYFGHSS